MYNVRDKVSKAEAALGNAPLPDSRIEAIVYATLRSLSAKGSARASDALAAIGAGRPLNDRTLRHLGIEPAAFTARLKAVSAAFELLPRDSRIIALHEADYPPLLKAAGRPPLFLFVRGDLNLLTTAIISVIGTRQPRTDGLGRAVECALALAGAGITVASGLARGIDSAALHACLDAGFPCIAVIGTPLNLVYPPENAELQERIAGEGLLLSPFSPELTVQRWFFPCRDAVMSGISKGSLIVEAGEKSGALIQADSARKQGRLVLFPRELAENPALSWPHKYRGRRGCLVFGCTAELLALLNSAPVDQPAARADPAFQPELFDSSSFLDLK